MGEAKKEIVNRIQKMSGRYSTYEIYSDWIASCALSIQNSLKMIHDKTWHSRENRYLDIMKKYTYEERIAFSEMFRLLGDAFEEGMSDILGEIYMESGCGNKNTGQFFTPFHLSYLTAAAGVPHDVSEDKPFIMTEPSTGGGGMIIAAAKVLQDRGINYQRCMDVVAQDLDWKGVYMTYVQLSLLGIKAVVVQGDTLKEPYVKGYPAERVFVTPAKMGMLI